MGFEPGLFSGRPCDLPGCAASANPSMSFAHCLSKLRSTTKEEEVRAVALDVHRDFCEVAIAEATEAMCVTALATAPIWSTD